MTTDTDIETLEQDLRALYAEVAPPRRRPSFDVSQVVSSDIAPSGVRAGSSPWLRGRALRRGGAVAAIAAVVVVGAVAVRSRPAAPAARPQLNLLSVSVLPSGGQLNCTIAVSALSDIHATGFITFAHGQAAFAPVTTTGNTYVRGLHRWVDTTPQMVAPDGNSYVTASGDQTYSVVQVVDATGTHTVLTVNRGFLGPLGFSPEGIVLLDTSSTTSGPNQSMPISLLDPRTGGVRVMPLPAYPQIDSPAGNGSGGSTGYQARTNSIWMQAYNTTSNISVVSRYDLTTGRTTVWFDGRTDGLGAAQPVAETATGAPIIQLAGSDIEHIAPNRRSGIRESTLLMTSPHTAQVINAGRVGDSGVADNLSPLSAIDGQDVWLAGDNGTLWRYQPGQGLRPMASIRTSTNGAPGVSISGACV
jgi:hypothetical protein